MPWAWSNTPHPLCSACLILGAGAQRRQDTGTLAWGSSAREGCQARGHTSGSGAELLVLDKPHTGGSEASGGLCQLEGFVAGTCRSDER